MFSQKLYRQSSQGKAARKAAATRYRQSAKGKAKVNAFNRAYYVVHRDAIITAVTQYAKTPAGKVVALKRSIKRGFGMLTPEQRDLLLVWKIRCQNVCD